MALSNRPGANAGTNVRKKPRISQDDKENLGKILKDAFQKAKDRETPAKRSPAWDAVDELKEKNKKILDDFNAKGDKIINDYKTKADKIISDSDSQTSKVLEKYNSDADKVIDNFNTKAGQITQKAHNKFLEIVDWVDKQAKADQPSEKKKTSAPKGHGATYDNSWENAPERGGTRITATKQPEGNASIRGERMPERSNATGRTTMTATKNQTQRPDTSKQADEARQQAQKNAQKQAEEARKRAQYNQAFGKKKGR